MSKPPSTELPLHEILYRLGEKRRLQILASLMESETGSGVSELAGKLGVRAPTVEKHLQILKRMGLVKKQTVLAFKRERWMLRSRKRTTKMLRLLCELSELMQAGRVFEDTENIVNSIRRLKETGMTVKELKGLGEDENRLDRLLERLKEFHSSLEEDEIKKVTYWSGARGTPFL